MTDPARTPIPIRFGPFEVWPDTKELRKNGTRLRLPTQASEILLLLVRNPGRVITREELKQTLWPDASFGDFDHGLNVAVNRLREALGDSADSPRFVETVPRRGYRFIALLSPSTLRITSPSPRKRTLVWLVGITAIATLAVIGVFLLVQERRRPAPIHSIAVLPFQNLSGDSTQEYFADAMTDELITDLAKVGALRITSRTTVSLYKYTDKPLPEIARELNVDGIVEGSIVRSGARVRITAQLIQAAADRHIWAETYERDLGDVLRLQSDVAQAVTQQVRAQLTPELKERFSRTRPVDPGAYEAYLKGRYYIYNQSFTDPSLNQAKANFEDAIRKDPNFSPAYSGLAETYIGLVEFGNGQITAADGYRSARDAIQRALALDPNNGEAYDALGELNSKADLDWKAAERSFNQAIALTPSFSCAHENRALLMALMGRRDEALMELEKSKQIDPGPVSAAVESSVYFQLRDWEHLLESSRVRLASDPNSSDVHADLGTAYEGTGKLPEAIAEYQMAVELSDGDLQSVASLGHAYAVMGRRREAQKILHAIEQKSKSGSASPYLAATIYAGLGQKDKAMELIEKAYREKSLDVSWILKPDLRTNNLRSDPRFQSLLQRVGLEQ